ncbi:hypothetical protein D3C77_282740 [compost metagenome]
MTGQLPCQLRKLAVLLSRELGLLAFEGQRFLERWWRPAKTASLQAYRVIAGRGGRNRTGTTDLALRLHDRGAKLVQLDRQGLASEGFARQTVFQLVHKTVAVGLTLVGVHVPADVR